MWLALRRLVFFCIRGACVYAQYTVLVLASGWLLFFLVLALGWLACVLVRVCTYVDACTVAHGRYGV